MAVSLPKLSWPYPIALTGFPSAPTPVLVQTESTGSSVDGTVTWKLGVEDTDQVGGVAFGPVPSAYSIGAGPAVVITDPRVVVTARSGAGASVRMIGAMTLYPTRVLLKLDGTVQVSFELNMQTGIQA